MTDARPRSAPMSADRWQRVQDLFAAAIECELTARAQFLLQGCGDDAELRREVESLLASHEKPGAVDRLAPAIAPAAAWARAQIAGWEGRRVRQYLVQELLDTGGMGVVYKAHDARLDRHVALKFLSPHLSKQPASKQRFLVEARAAAALDDPHICTILEIGETEDGQLFIVMPLYDGETVQARLKRGRLPFDDAIHIAVQIARGVGRAHAGGVVHRDIKPSNVMLLPNGTVKILDFGIASTEALSAAPAEGRFGTLPYMSPEHIRSAPIDRRSDVWSLGVLVHEMLTGVRPFYGDDAHSLAEAIFNREPNLVATSHPDVPAGLDRVLRRALAKQVEDRYPSMGAFAADLTALLRRSEPSRAGWRFEAPIARSWDAAGETERRRAAVRGKMVYE